MRLAIADPPYPPMLKAAGGVKNRASRWYGKGQRSHTDRPADHHEAAADWDNPDRHRQLLADLQCGYDGWAIATTPDALEIYSPLPVGARVMAWFKPNAQPGAHRLRSNWEPVILYPPKGRRSNVGRGQLSDVLIANAPRGFKGAKPPEWTAWVLDALGYDPTQDHVADLFPGSGAVGAAVLRSTLALTSSGDHTK